MIYSAVRVTKLLLIYHARIITTSSMAYSGANASEHLLIIINGENLLYQQQKTRTSCVFSAVGTAYFSTYHRLSKTFRYVTAPRDWNSLAFLLLIYRRLLMLFQLKQFRAAATSALIHTRIYRCYCSSFIAVSAGSLNALVMWQQWTFSVRHLHHQHHHHHHHPRVNETTTQRQLRRLLQTIAEKAVHIFQSLSSNTGIETVTDNCYLLQNSLSGLLRMDIDNSSVCIVLNVLFYLLISFIKSSSMDARPSSVDFERWAYLIVATRQVLTLW